MNGDPRAGLVHRALRFDGPAESNKALFELRQYEALWGGDTGERILRYLKIRSEQSAPPVPPERGKLTEAALELHLKSHPIGKRRPDGSPISDNWRAERLKNEQGIRVDRTTLVKRLKPYRHPPTA